MKEHIKKYLHKNLKNTRKINKTQKEINDLQFYIGTNKQALEYKAAAELIINCIKRKFDRGNDEAETLQTLKIQDFNKWMPILKMSNETYQTVVTRGNKRFELEYKAMPDGAIKRIKKYNQNMFKTCAFLWENIAVLCKIKSQEEAILTRKYSMILLNYELQSRNTP